MKIKYDKYYEEENLFGEPYKELVGFFREYSPKGTVLDIGCGQGRDAIALGKLGYDVTGIDHSGVGIMQLNEKARSLGLAVRGEVIDFMKYDGLGRFDIALMDSILHFYKRDIKRETEIVEKVLNELKTGGIFCNCIVKGRKREDILKKIIADSGFGFSVLYENYVKYPEHNMHYHIYIIQKQGG